MQIFTNIAFEDGVILSLMPPEQNFLQVFDALLFQKLDSDQDCEIKLADTFSPVLLDIYISLLKNMVLDRDEVKEFVLNFSSTTNLLVEYAEMKPEFIQIYAINSERTESMIVLLS